MKQEGLCFDFIIISFSFLTDPFLLLKHSPRYKEELETQLSQLTPSSYFPWTDAIILSLPSHLTLYGQCSTTEPKKKKQPILSYISIQPLTFLKVSESYSHPRTVDKVSKDMPVYKETSKVYRVTNIFTKVKGGKINYRKWWNKAPLKLITVVVLNLGGWEGKHCILSSWSHWIKVLGMMHNQPFVEEWLSSGLSIELLNASTHLIFTTVHAGRHFILLWSDNTESHRSWVIC